MFRICLRIFPKHISVSEPTLKNLITSKYKCISVSNILSSRQCSSKNDDKLEHIYYGPLTPQIKAVKLFSLSSSIAGVVAQPIIIREAATIGSTPLLVAICSVVGFFTFVTPILLHLITKKYVSDIYYEPDSSTYKCTTYNFFLQQKEHAFKVDDVQVPDIPGMFTTIKAKGKPLFVEARHFTDPMHYAKMLGYDKPMDFKLGEISDAEQK